MFDITGFLKIAIDEPDVELEFIYGDPFKGSIDKETFLRLLDYCKSDYKFIEEENYLDIRCEHLSHKKVNISNIRSTLKGLETIKKYCKNDTLADNVSHMRKFKHSEEPIKNIDYDFRINLKKEIELNDNNEDIIALKSKWSSKNKHMRYKKRYSFLTHDYLYQIDLTIVKSTSYNDALNRYELFKTFKECNILNQPEQYEVEIEFVGNRKQDGQSNLDKFIRLLDTQLPDDKPSIYQALSPRLNYIDPKIQEEKLKDIIGDYVFIRDTFLNTLDQKMKKDLSGKNIAYVEKLQEKDGKTYAELSITDYDNILVPITEIYNDQWNSEEMNAPAMKVEITDEIINSINEKFNEIIFELLYQIHQTKLLITNSKKTQILNKYYKLTNQKNRRKVFMAPQPATLNMQGLNKDNPGSIYINYAVTEKADGTRYLLYIDETKRGYLINSKFDKILDTGIEFDVNGEWILDGEYIQKDKDNNDIQLYMIFDIYWAGNTTPEPPYTYIFYGGGWDSLTRMDSLNNFKEIIKNMKIIDGDFNQFRIAVKDYEFGSTEGWSGIETDEYLKKIFIKSKKILNRSNDGGYEYEIDGLIFLPVNLPVNASVDGRPVEFINGTWELNYKWKPPEENTIDFKVKIIKETITKKKSKVTKDKIMPFTKI